MTSSVFAPTGQVGEPPRDCTLCPRLVTFRHDNQKTYPAFYNGAVPSFGDPAAELLIVGLAPGLKGANRTGRPFTGDYAGDLLYPTLIKYGFADGQYRADPQDGLTLKRALITNAVRCVPPQNKPTSQEEKTCRPFLTDKINALPHVRLVLALGLVAHNAVLSAFGLKKSAYRFAHGALHELGNIFERGSTDCGPERLALIDSYHCSRYNTNTGRLTPEMFEQVFDKITAYLER
ncbi:uracil-DNA glycosylase [Luteithermobacter gelatinilyticus]|uniref:uracil-DNA glycosylase n=1 Tax=Luteithermobacter gelatinilyticus TaxID=2582913 RepID=UPI00110741B0|nr:uracil-DNA glycosylase [Luteithermobacter gelatinilyticus]|tara:strand:+ start:5185 stop:5886 length:702 start_codon:yes stop_codon:yes gene_type:complete